MLTLAEAINDFLKVDRADKTNAGYTQILTRMKQHIGPDRDLQAVKLAHLLDFTKSLSVQVKPSSLFSYSLIIKAFFSWCERVDYLDHSPARKLTIRRPAKDVKDKGIPPAHARAILEAASAHPRDYALVLFFGETAARLSAVTGLRTTDLDLDNCTATLIEKRRKPVVVYFSRTTATALREWIKVRGHLPHDYVWTRTRPLDHKPLTVAGVTHALLRLSKEACGIQYGPHRWRHTVSERWEDAGVQLYDIAHKLNQSDPAVTREWYLRNRNPNVRGLSKKLSLIAFGWDADEPTNIITLDDCG